MVDLVMVQEVKIQFLVQSLLLVVVEGYIVLTHLANYQEVLAVVVVLLHLEYLLDQVIHHLKVHLKVILVELVVVVLVEFLLLAVAVEQVVLEQTELLLNQDQEVQGRQIHFQVQV